ncbi:hypothetical protein IV203_036234 [Nitzschia inconspicua]|uniref:Uncharacterized protein n=1 Tax=Nitzschia inconspicua TaxID=303405 RepID=A0A9K3LG26_9STRA|nr:hypothetical protein IV203_036234 [Nitzschia inconspicua]
MHQAVVTQFDYGMFVTSKVDDGSRSILQVVIIEIPTATREEHASKLCAIANPILGFLHRQNIVERGFLTDDDCPSWVTATQGTILKTRAKLYYAHLKLIRDTDGRLHPMPPLLLYKHSAQYRYNKAKPGLDMNTEISANVVRHAVASRGNSTPSLKQLRNHLYRKGSIRQFVFNTSYESLRLIAIQKTIIRPPFFPPANTQRTLGETFFLQQYTSYCRMNSWPIKRNARERFVEDPFLQKLRLRSFVGFEHKAEPIRDVISGVTAGPDGAA